MATEKLPYGCIMGTEVIKGVNSFIIRPCDIRCQYYQYVLEEIERQGKPIEFK